MSPMRIASILVFAGACSPSSSDHAPKKTLGALSTDERPQLCERVAAYRAATSALPGFDNVRCGGEALMAAGYSTTPDTMRASCTKALDECVAIKPITPPIDCVSSPGEPLVAGILDALESCASVTVDELLACTEETRAMISKVAPPCTGPFDPKDPSAGYNRFIRQLHGPRCAVLDWKCR